MQQAKPNKQLGYIRRKRNRTPLIRREEVCSGSAQRALNGKPESTVEEVAELYSAGLLFLAYPFLANPPGLLGNSGPPPGSFYSFPGGDHVMQSMKSCQDPASELYF